MKLTLLDYIPWLLSIALQIGLALLMVRRRLHKRYPAIFQYLLFWSVANPVTLLAAQGRYATYFYTFWAAQFISYLLQLRVCAEIFRSIARRLDADIVRGFLISCGIVAGAVIFLDTFDKRSFTSLSLDILIRTQNALYFIRAGIFILAVVFASKAGIANDGRNMKLVAGFGVYAGAALVITGIRLQLGPGHAFLSWIQSWCYVASLLLWLRAFYPQPVSNSERRRALAATATTLEQSLAALKVEAK